MYVRQKFFTSLSGEFGALLYYLCKVMNTDVKMYAEPNARSA